MGKYREAEVPAAHLGSLLLFPALPGTQIRGIRVLDFLHVAERSGVSGLLASNTSGFGTRMSLPLFFPGMLIPNEPWLQTISLLHFLTVDLSLPFLNP